MTRVTDIDDVIAQQICETMEFEGQRFHLGEFVAILDGKVIASGDRFEDALGPLEALAPDRNRGLLVQVAPEEPDVIRSCPGSR